MITVVSSDDLQEAMERPELHQSLVVRVGGYSARFVDLSRDLQLEILERTLNESCDRHAGRRQRRIAHRRRLRYPAHLHERRPRDPDYRIPQGVQPSVSR